MPAAEGEGGHDAEKVRKAAAMRMLFGLEENEAPNKEDECRPPRHGTRRFVIDTRRAMSDRNEAFNSAALSKRKRPVRIPRKAQGSGATVQKERGDAVGPVDAVSRIRLPNTTNEGSQIPHQQEERRRDPRPYRGYAPSAFREALRCAQQRHLAGPCAVSRTTSPPLQNESRSIPTAALPHSTRRWASVSRNKAAN